MSSVMSSVSLDKKTRTPKKIVDNIKAMVVEMKDIDLVELEKKTVTETVVENKTDIVENKTIVPKEHNIVPDAATREELRFMKYFTYVADYSYFLVLCVLYNVAFVSTDSFFVPFLEQFGIQNNGTRLAIAIVGCLVTLFNINTMMVRDWCYKVLFKKHIAPQKVNYKFGSSDLWAYIESIIGVFSLVFPLFYVDCFYWETMFDCQSYLPCVSTIVVLYLEFLTMSLIKDLISMEWLHRLMHHPKFYWMHKKHHKTYANVQVSNLWHIDFLDLAIENLIAPIFLVVAKYWVMCLCFGAPAGSAGMLSGFFSMAFFTYGKMHFMSYVLLGIFDINTHGVNPYSVMFFNPLLDYILKPNVQHNLHHALNVGYYTFWPFHQLSWNLEDLIKGEEKEKDLAKYNKVMKTQFVY